MVVIMEIILEIHMVISKDSLAKVHLCDLISCDILPALTAELMSQ